MEVSPGGATELMEILGRDETLRRIRTGIELLESKAAETVAPAEV